MRISPLSSAVISAALLTGAVACGKSEPKLNVEQAPAAAPATAAPAAVPQQAQAMPPSTAPAGAPAGMMSGHAGAAPASMPGLASLNGSVVETMDAGGYTYMRLKLAEGGETWAAVNASKVKKGDKVTVVNAMPMDGFESKTLNRKFDRILFGQLGNGAALAAGMPAAGMPSAPSAVQSAQMAQQHAGISSAPDPGKVDVPKAEGADAKRIAEVFAQKAQLEGKSVTIRAKVVKFTPGVMGRNWIHLRDGSGTVEAKDHDITVTSNDSAAMGDVVVVRGKVGVGRDFGMGYSYPVLIEEAKVTK